MRITAQEEYGLRCLLQLAVRPGLHPIADIARRELLTPAHVAKLLRVLRLGGIVESVRGQRGGYHVARPPSGTSVAQALTVLDGRFDRDAFCRRHRAGATRCAHAESCPLRPLWSALDRVTHAFLSRFSLSDLLRGERAMQRRVRAALAPLREVIGPAR